MAGRRFPARLVSAIGDPWALLLSALGGGTAWAFGVSVPLSVGTAAVMLGTAGVIGALPRADESAQLRRGTRQAALVDLLDGHLRSLRAMRTEALPGLLAISAADALAAGDRARCSAVRLAAAVDELDATIAAARNVSGQGKEAVRSIQDTTRRLRARQNALLDRLTGAVDEVATVYAGLLELSATARTMGVSLDSTEVTRVTDTVVLLQATFAELESDVAALRAEGVY
jgi:hypothetical protein